MENPEMLEACHHYIKERVFPLLYIKSKERAVVHGTGFIIEIKQDKYLLTAKHVLEETEQKQYERIAFPIFGPKKEMYSLPCQPYLSNPETDADIAIVPLKYEKEISDQMYWKTFDMNSFYLREKIYDKQKIIVHGFPVSMQEVDRANPFIDIGVISFTTHLYRGDYSKVEKYDPKIDIIFESINEMYVNGKKTELPKLHGISGSALFCLDHSVDGIWSPEKCLKIIGIEKAIKPRDYIRATKSSCIYYSIKRLLEVD